MIAIPRVETPLGPAAGFAFWEGPAPWRAAIVRGFPEVGGLTVRLVQEDRIQGSRTRKDEPVFVGEARGQVHPREWVLWGLPEWRKTVGPQAFMDVLPHDVLGWVRGQCGGQALIRVPNRPIRRHVALHRLPAWEAVLRALEAFGLEAVLHELDGGILYIGPKEESPHWPTVHRLKDEIAELRPMGGGLYYLRAAPLPALRIYNLLQVDHPRYQGALRVYEHRLNLDPALGRVGHEVWAYAE